MELRVLLAPLLAVMALNLYAVLLVWGRARRYGVQLYRPMLVNVVMSLAPIVVAIVGIAVSLAITSLPGINPLIFLVILALGFSIWVLVFPNSSYLITELNFSHRRPDDPVPLWYDIVLTLTLAVSGIANGIVGLGLMHFFSIVIVDANHTEPYPPTWSWAFVMAVIVLSTVGVYLGRYVRVNSWDVKHPISFIRRLGRHFAAGATARDLAGFVVAHSVFLGLVYAAVFMPVFNALIFSLPSR